jgi:serine/threonine protein kinase
MVQPSVNHFLQSVERSGLVDRARLDEVLASLERDLGPAALQETQIVSSHLTGHGLLTGWQNERLLEGRHRGFFLGKYKLLDHLGTGGMSAVYLAEHRLMRRRVAIKVLPSNHAEDPSRVRRFHREARAVASLDHPHVVRAFDVDQDGDVHFLVMEYVQGRDLKTIVDQDGPLPPVTAAEYIRQAAEGLACAHQFGLVHRDMKPANLIIDPHGSVKVLDLGLASVKDDVDGAITSEFDDKVLGTVDFLAPEQALNSHIVDGRADIYSLGCTLYFALTGHPPFGDGSLGQRIMAHQMRQPPDIRQQRPDVPEGIVQICRRMMAKSPSARYQNMQEVAAALAAWQRAPEPALPQPTPDKELALAPLSEEPVWRKGDRKTRVGPPSGSSRRKPQSSPSGGSKPTLHREMGKPQDVRKRRPKSTRSLLDDLVNEGGAASMPSARLGPVMANSVSQHVRTTRSRWESPWFLIAIGASLGMLLIVAYFVIRLIFA